MTNKEYNLVLEYYENFPGYKLQYNALTGYRYALGRYKDSHDILGGGYGTSYPILALIDAVNQFRTMYPGYPIRMNEVI